VEEGRGEKREAGCKLTAGSGTKTKKFYKRDKWARKANYYMSWLRKDCKEPCSQQTGYIISLALSRHGYESAA